MTADVELPVYRTPSVARKLAERELDAQDGADKGWVHTAMLAWQRHARFRLVAAECKSKQLAG